MALQGFGQISFSDLRDEFSDLNPIEFGDYYRGGSLVPNTSTNSSIPTSGQIAISDFYGTSDGGGGTTLTPYSLLRATSESNACNNSGTNVTVYQNSSSFNFTDPIYSDSGGNTLAPSGWYKPFFEGFTRFWTGFSWSGSIQDCGGGGIIGI